MSLVNAAPPQKEQGTSTQNWDRILPSASRFTVLVTFAVMLLVGCAAPQKQLSREEWLQVRNHHYENRSPEQVFKAAEQLFKLADGSDVTFSHNDDSLKAVRWAAPFPINIWFHWDVKATLNGNATNVNVTISTSASGFGVPGGMTPYNLSDVITLFYSRLDYLLGRSTVWQSCVDYERQNPEASTLEALCLLADDLPPTPIGIGAAVSR